MSKNKKTNIIYFFPGPIYRPDLSNFKDRFEMLSGNFEGEVYSWACDSKFKEYPIESFVFRGFIEKSKGLPGKWQLAWHMISRALRYHKNKKVDVIICYDPLFTGILGCILKACIKAKLVIEINNSNIPYAVRISSKNLIVGWIRYWAYKCIIAMTCSYANRLKVLSPCLKKHVSERFFKKISIFHDYVPTHFFLHEPKAYEKKILFAGFPFYRKGVDVLVKAFNRVKNDFPNFTLVLIGHQLQENTQNLPDWDDRQIDVRKAVEFNDLKKELLSCYCFVLASREEGLPRVLIEAMACSKALVGTRVGGVPDLIDDKINGFLVDSDDVVGLSDKLRILMSDNNLAECMGQESLKVVEEKFSSQVYLKKFIEMIDQVLCESGRRQIALMYHGIVANPGDLLPARNGIPREYDVDLKNFEDQMAWFSQKYPGGLVTFDDGEQNNFKNAFPVLKRLGLRAYFFIFPDNIGAPGFMSSDQIRELADAGMIIGSHGYSHCDLTKLNDQELSKELTGSKIVLEEMSGKEVFSLSVPFGAYKKHVLDAARQAGYQQVFVSDCLGSNCDCVRRVAVRRDWNMRRFQNAALGRFPISDRLKVLFKKKFLMGL